MMVDLNVPLYLGSIMLMGLSGGLAGWVARSTFGKPKPTLETKLLRRRNLELSVTAATLSVALENACAGIVSEIGEPGDRDHIDKLYDSYYDEAYKQL